MTTWHILNMRINDNSESVSQNLRLRSEKLGLETKNSQPLSSLLPLTCSFDVLPLVPRNASVSNVDVSQLTNPVTNLIITALYNISF